MAKITARDARVIIEGHDVSGDSNSVTLTRNAEAPEVTCFQDSVRTRLAGGVRDIEMTVDGFVNTSASGTDQLYKEYVNQEVRALFLPENWTYRKIGHAFTGIISNYESSYSVEDAATTSITVTGSGVCFRGRSLGYISGEAGSTSGCQVDVTGSIMDAGAWVQWHILSIGGCDVSACIEHSSNNSTYATAIDLGTVSTAGQTITASISSMNRFARLRYASGSVSTMVAFVGVSSSTVN